MHLLEIEKLALHPKLDFFIVKELGDVVNWSSIIERDFKNVVEKMEDFKSQRNATEMNKPVNSSGVSNPN